MATFFRLDIFTPDETVFSGDAISLTVPASSGYLGVLAYHAPMVAMLTSGKVVVKDGSGMVRKFKISGTGCLEVADNAATLLLEETEPYG